MAPATYRINWRPQLVTNPLLSQTSDMLDAAGRVAVNAPCVHCGYNLRTLLADGLCPECAQPVRRSLYGQFLHFAAPPWIKGLARGLLLLLIALGVGVVGGPLLFALLDFSYLVTGATMGPGPLPTAARHISLVRFLVYLPALALAMAGVLLFTRRDPGFGDRPEGLTARRVARLGAFLLPLPIVALLLTGLLAAVLMPTMFAPGAFAWYMIIGAVSTLIGLTVYVVTLLALLRHLSALLSRIPRPGLARFARVEFWGLGLSATVACAGYVFLLVVMIPAMSTWMAALPPTTTLPTTGPVAFVPTSGPGSPYQMTVTSAGGTMIVTTTGPAGATVATTLPTLPPPPPGVFIGGMVGGCAGAAGAFGTLGFGIAGIVLLILACKALYGVARLAARDADVPAGPWPPDANPPLAAGGDVSGGASP